MGVTVEGNSSKRKTQSKKQQPKEQKRISAPSAAANSMDEAPSFENPLVPHAVLRQMYQRIAETRLLAEYAAKLSPKSKFSRASYGQEACRVSVTLGLKPGDVVLDSQSGNLTGYLLGATLPELLKSLRTKPIKTKKKANAKPETSATGLMPFVEDGEVRLLAALGVAQLLKQLQRLDTVVVYLEHHEAAHSVWRRALTLAAKQELPIIFVVLPKSKPKHGKLKSKAEISSIALKCGVPGIAVESSDAIALYRVSQESLGRIRGGGGPVLIEGVVFPFHEHPKLAADPVAQIKQYIVQRKIAPESWMAAIEANFKQQLAATSR